MIDKSAMPIVCSLFSLVLMCICGCGERTKDLPRKPNQAVRDSERESVSSVQEPGDEQPAAASDVTIKPLLPRPIQTEEEAKACMEAALEFDRSIRDLVAEDTGVRLEPPRTEVLKDCVVQYDRTGRGYSKFYPDDTLVRFYMRGSDVGDANVFIPNCETAVVHVTIDWRLRRPGEAEMRITCSDARGKHSVDVVLHVEAPIWSSGPPTFTSSGNWSQIAEPEELVKYCMGLYEEFVQLREWHPPAD